jgi:HD-GYP domain-containing protein (c-di-GMP phosphodiesterase class II)
MRLMSIDNVKENMQLARNIDSADGRVLLSEGVSLTANYIERLRDLGIMSLYITDRLIGKVEVDDLVRVQTRNEANRMVKESMGNIRDGRSVSGEKVYKVISEVLDEILSKRSISFNLVDIRAMNDYLFGHSLTVCILSLMTGVAAGFNFARLRELGIGAVLHDVGKVLIPDSILNKAEALTPDEFAEIQKHSQIGYDVLKKCNDISSVSAYIAWQHHEKFDGTGYPRGVKGKEIYEFARVVAIADVYDALSTDRIYRKRWLPHEALEYIRDKDKEAFDPEFVKLFLSNIEPFPIGSTVLLNNNEKGVIIKVPKNFAARPIVRIIFDPAGVPLDQPIDRNLREDLTLFIAKALKDDEMPI